jgi:hypothetical protein
MGVLLELTWSCDDHIPLDSHGKELWSLGFFWLSRGISRRSFLDLYIESELWNHRDACRSSLTVPRTLSRNPSFHSSEHSSRLNHLTMEELFPTIASTEVSSGSPLGWMLSPSVCNRASNFWVLRSCSLVLRASSMIHG